MSHQTIENSGNNSTFRVTLLVGQRGNKVEMRTNRYNKQKKQPIYFWTGKTVKATSNLSRTGYPRNSAALPINKIQRRTKDPSGGSMNFNYSAQRPLEVSSGAQNGRRQLAGSFSFFLTEIQFNSSEFRMNFNVKRRVEWPWRRGQLTRNKMAAVN